MTENNKLPRRAQRSLIWVMGLLAWFYGLATWN